ncbi:sensor histidine kinase [Streptomyces sp. NPDC000229]|uniref:sensor histidine kinase n=1 Tax=Streptomyces sp. NPDC000229 TaxID=3154247 RepID=UPI00332F6152
MRRLAAAALPVLVAIVDGLVVNGLASGHELWVALIAAAALLVRWRAPEVALVAGLPGLYLGHIAFAPLIALYCLAVRRRRVLFSGMGAVLVTLAQFLPYPIADLSALPLDQETLLVALDACVLGTGAVVLGRSARLRRERLREVTESRQRENRLLTERVLATERARLAREMHDVVAHKVSLISLQAGALQVGEPHDVDVRQSAGAIRELSVQTITELQHMVGVLRAAGGSPCELAPQPRLTDIPALAHATGLDVTLDLPGVPAPEGVPEAVERAAYRTVQEALTNVRKHAPGADAHVRVHVDARTLRVEVRNTPPEPTAPPLELPGGGHGLVGLRERAHLLGGTFRAHTPAGGGFVIEADFPL